MFANALQDRYALKKVNNSASLGVGVLGSVSMPIGSTDDSMVKVASETVTSPKFYDRYFALVDVFLPQEVKAAEHIPEAPKADLGVPEPKPAPVVDKVQAPQEAPTMPVAPPVSEPLAPPVEATPIAPEAVPAEVPAPTAPVLPPPTETIPPLPANGQ